MLPPSVTGAATADSRSDDQRDDDHRDDGHRHGRFGGCDRLLEDLRTVTRSSRPSRAAPKRGTLEGMANDPVATAAASNPGPHHPGCRGQGRRPGRHAEQRRRLTVFAPTDCAFAALDPATLKAALDDPSGLLTTVLGYHVIAGQRLSAADLPARSPSSTTFTGEMLPVRSRRQDHPVGGQSPRSSSADIQTANATVLLSTAS